MDYTIFVKNKFLNTTIGNFAKDFDKTDYKGFENIVKLIGRVLTRQK